MASHDTTRNILGVTLGVTLSFHLPSDDLRAEVRTESVSGEELAVVVPMPCPTLMHAS